MEIRLKEKATSKTSVEYIKKSTKNNSKLVDNLCGFGSNRPLSPHNFLLSIAEKLFDGLKVVH